MTRSRRPVWCLLVAGLAFLPLSMPLADGPGRDGDRDPLDGADQVRLRRAIDAEKSEDILLVLLTLGGAGRSGDDVRVAPAGTNLSTVIRDGVTDRGNILGIGDSALPYISPEQRVRLKIMQREIDVVPPAPTFVAPEALRGELGDLGVVM